MASSKRKPRTAHPGVTIVKPDSGRRAYSLRFINPDTGRWTKERLDPERYRNARERLEAAKIKSRELARRVEELECGAARMEGRSLEDVIERYFDDHRQLRERTLADYRDAADKLIAWCRARGILSIDQLDRAALLSYRAHSVNAPRMTPAKGGKRGERVTTKERRSPRTANREIRAVRTILGYLRLAGLTPRLTGDDLSDALKQVRVSRDTVDFLKSSEIAQALEAALEHDALKFEATRRELSSSGLYRRGSTPRYDEIGPFTLTALLTGMRRGELMSLEWSDVDLDALDEEGKVSGEIRVRAAKSKTGIGRIVDLAPSPSLRELFEVMRAESAEGLVFNFTGDQISAARRRLVQLGAPESFGWQACRRTCASYLANASGIYGGASIFREAKRLGHSVAVSERSYAGVVNVPREARTLEEAMGIESQARAIIAAAKERRRPREG